MDREDLTRRLMATFLGELDEHVRALNRDLLALERHPDEGRAELLEALHRTAHSLKGAARSVNVGVVETACHHLEEILGRVRDGIFPLDPTLVQLLFTAADGLGEVGRRLRDTRDVAGSPLETLLPGLDAARAGGPPPASPAPAPAAPSPGGQPPPGDEGYVRVPVEKLDRLLASCGELLVARRRVAKRHEDVAGLLGTAHQAHTEWRRLERTFRGLAVPNGRAGGPDRAGRERRGAATRAAAPEGAPHPFGRIGGDLERLERALEGLLGALQADQQVLDKAAGPLEEEIRRARMLPFAEACDGLERAVRDLARAAGKEAEVTVEGGDVELDRSILQALRDPLLHLVRNAVDHGVEPPAERQALGKPPRARIVVGAVLKGTGVEITVTDDGRGLDLDAIAELARRKRIPVPRDRAELARLVFLPGFSTAPLVTEVSGRGIGLDVVKNRVEALHGSVDLSSDPDRCRFVLAVPLTLTTIRALLVGCAGHVFALPTAGVRSLLRAGPAELGSVEGREMVLAQGGPLPAVSLAGVLGIPTPDPAPGGARVPFVVLTDGGHETAFAVGDLLAEQEVVVKSLGPRLRRVRNVTGATVLPTGRVALILSPAELVRCALRRAPGHVALPTPDVTADAPGRRLLVVDDSVTTRSLERSILEAAGYEVTVAVDGAEAWRTLQDHGSDLVVADVEMPGMDGFALTEAIRGSARFRHLPVVLVTARESDRDKRRGLEVGADAYLPKSTFDQAALLQTIAQLL